MSFHHSPLYHLRRIIEGSSTSPIREWVKELSIVTSFIKSKYKAARVSINGNKEAGLAGLYRAALKGNIENVTLSSAPLSYCLTIVIQSSFLVPVLIFRDFSTGAMFHSQQR